MVIIYPLGDESENLYNWSDDTHIDDNFHLGDDILLR